MKNVLLFNIMMLLTLSATAQKGQAKPTTPNAEITTLANCMSAELIDLQMETSVLEGLVYDYSNDEALIGAHVKVFDKNRLVKADVTDLDGLYKIHIKPGKYQIEISYIGYQTHYSETKDLQAQKSTSISTALKPGITISEIIIVSAPKTKVEQRIIACGYPMSCASSCSIKAPKETEETQEESIALLRAEVFPNPAIQRTTLRSNENIKSVYLYDSQGRLLWQNSSVQSLQVDIRRDQWPAGVYFLQIETEQEWITKQLVFVD